MGVMDSSIDIDTFLRSLRATKPPWECPKCQKIYKSYSGMEYHMLKFDHDAAPMTPSQKPTPSNSNRKGPRSKFAMKKKGGRMSANTPRRSPSPIGFASPARETLTWAEAQRMVEVESEGKIYRLDINEKLDVISDSDVDKDDDSNSGNSSDGSLDTQNQEDSKKNITKEDGGNSGPAGKNGKSKTGGKPAVNSKDLKSVTLPIQRDGNSAESKPVEPKLPVPSFRVVSAYGTEAADAPERRMAYYRYIERPVEELAEEVEYDMDEEDSVWLELLNENRKKESLQIVSADQFELLMDRFEKESYFEQAKNGDHHRAQQMIDEDAVCCVCNDGECQNSNVILFCDMCNLAVHQECYGVPYIPEGQWLCRRCLQSPSCPVDCCLCPNRGGAFKQTDDGRWAHVVCALWVPEVTFANTVFLEPIDGLKRIPAARWKLSCYICKQRNSGACIQCHRTNCYTAFHVTCAQQAGLYMKMDPVRETGKNGVTVTVRKAAFCDVHRPANATPTKPLRNTFEFEEMDKEREKQALSDSREKMKKARKILAEKRQEMPHIAIPYIPRAKMASISKIVTLQKRGSFMQRLLSYWTLKRQSRNGVPLLRRLQSNLQSQKNPDSCTGTPEQNELLKQLKYWQRLRHDLERARLLIELIRKREKLKREQIKISQAVSDLQLSPWLNHLHHTLDRLRTLDTANVFALPVNVRDAPEYDKIIKHPMDFSTMEKKIDGFKYKSMDDFETDVNLIVNNCMLYNTRDTIFFRLALKLRDQGGTVIRNAKRDSDKIGFDPETGFLLNEAPQVNEESPGKILTEIDRLIDGHDRTDLSYEDQLKNLFDKLDFTMTLKNGVGKAYKAKKLRAQILKLRRRMSQAKKNAEEAGSSPDKPSTAEKVTDVKSENERLSDHSKSFNKPGRRKSTSGQNKKEKENSHSPNLSPSFSRSMSSPDGPKKNPRFRKRRWSNLSENMSENDSKRPRRRSVDAFALPHKGIKRSASTMVESSIVDDVGVDSANEFRPESVNRRSAVLFNKKRKRNSNPVSRQNSDENTKSSNYEKEDSSRPLSDSAVVSRPLPNSCRNSRRSPSPEVMPLRKTRSSDSCNSNASSDSGEKITRSRRKSLTNGFLPSPGRKGSKPESFLVYREESRRQRTSSDTDTTSSSSSNDNRRKSKKRSSITSAKLISRRSSCSVMENRRRMNRRSNSPSSNGDSDDTDKMKPSVVRKRRRTTGSSSTEEEQASDSCNLEALDLVWAKCRGYPSYPALIIDPNMPRNGYFHNGVPIPVPPFDVLKVGESKLESNHKHNHLYLVLFFDNKRTWQWLPASKLKPLGLDEKSDRLKLYEGKRPGIRRSVTQAYQRAIIHRRKVSGEIPDSDDEIHDDGNFAEEEDSSDSVN
uniref:peregrin-like n=1 Tax=Styela clava TaxID=7725 RepID=UPI00193A5C93|nr:peregrin-like [Styela clava]